MVNSNLIRNVVGPFPNCHLSDFVLGQSDPYRVQHDLEVS